MASQNRVVLVVNDEPDQSAQLKELIEFMDVPSVRASTPGDWRSGLGDQRLEAIFLGPQLSAENLTAVLFDVKAFDPNIPIVVVGEDPAP